MAAKLVGLGFGAVCAVASLGADPVLIPAAPAPGPTTPGYLNPVPGGVTTPVAPAVSGQPGVVVPGALSPPACPPVAYPPIVECPRPSVVWWYGGDYSFGLGSWHAPSVPGYRIGYSEETLAETSRRLDPQALPAMSSVGSDPVSPQQEAVGLLRSGRYDLAVGALGVLVAHARDASAGALNVPPGAAAPAVQPGVPGVPGVPVVPVVPVVPGGPAKGEADWTVGEAQRLLAVALLGQRLDAHAVRAVGEAYSGEPGLCEHPLNGGVLGGPGELRRLMLRAVSHAQKVGTSDAWFLAAVLMQAQGRNGLPGGVLKGVGTHPLGQRLAAWRGGSHPGGGPRVGTRAP